MDKEGFWNTFLNVLSSKLNNISFNTWFKDADIISLDNHTLTICAANKYKKDYINNYYENIIKDVLKEVSNEEYDFEVICKEDIKEEEVIIEEPIMDMPKFKNNNCSNLNPNYTFDNFVVGNSNRLAQTVGLSVAEQPGKLYNPLFIYGKSGLGKTHLMHAIGNFVTDNSNKSVLYVTSERFITDFTQINRKDDNNLDLIAHFKEKYRSVDVLIIDDIQFLGGANKTQDEFFNTFNELYSLNKQIIISSDRSPDDLKVLEERLRTRFTWGLTVNIMPPDYELRLKIVKNKIAGHEVSKMIAPEVLEYIANNCENDVRHLEGAINRLYAVTAMYSPKEINLEFAKDALKDYIGSSVYITNNVTKIQKAVAEYYDLTVESLKSKKRTSIINHARQVAIYLCKMTTEETLDKIGLEFNRDHATVIHACDKIADSLKQDDELKEEINKIKDKIMN